MSIQVYSIPYQTDGRTCKRRKASLEWKINLCSKLSLTCGSNVNYYKSVHHPITTCGNSRKHPGNTYNISESSLFNWVSWYILFLSNWREDEDLFWRVHTRRGATLWDHLAVIRDDKYVDRFQDLPKVKTPAASKAKV